MPFQKFGSGQILPPEPDEREQMSRTASRIERDPNADQQHEGHYEEEDVE